VAVVGNPNAGKTTIFNALTGSHQKVGNYPGVTVERVSGQFQFEGQTVECIDVPGLYSLEHQSEDERVAAEVIRGIDSPKPDLLVCVIDATNLERNLFLFSQVADLRQPTMVALTMTDRVTMRGDVIDIDVLSDMLMVDVVPLVGHRDQGIQELRAAIVRNLESPRVPRLCIERNAELSTAADALCDRLARLGVDYTLCDAVRELQTPTPTFVQFAQDTPELADVFFSAREELGKAGLLDSTSEVTGRYAWSEKVQRKAIRRDREYQHKSRTDMIDAVLTHRVFGLAIFVGLMYLVFQSIYTFAQPLMDLIDGAFGALGVLSERLSPRLCGIKRADSLAFDFHKWLHVNYDAGFILMRSEEDHRRTFSERPEYLKGAERGLAAGNPWPVEYGPELSRGFRALKVWAQLAEHGTAKLGALITQNCEQAAYLGELVTAHAHLRLMAPVAMNICCFRYQAEDQDDKTTDALNGEIVIQLQIQGIAAPSTTLVNGRNAIRVNITNHRTTRADLALLVREVERIGLELTALS
jgi:small GTP-binding protein